MARDLVGLRGALLKTIMGGFQDIIPYDMANTPDQINRWADDHKIRPFAVWLSLHMGFRRLPEPYFSFHLCNLIDRVWALYRITQNTRYSEIREPTVLHVLKIYKEMRKYSFELSQWLNRTIPHDIIQLGMQQYATLMTYERCSTQTSPLWKLVNARERLRCLTHAALGDEFPYSGETYRMAYGGVGDMVRSYIQQTNMQSFISPIDGRFVCCDVGGVVPPEIYELSASFGMTQLPEPYTTLQATTRVPPNPASTVANSARFMQEHASFMALKLHTQLQGLQEYNNRMILDFYLPEGLAMAKLNQFVRTLRDEIHHRHGSLMPLRF